MKKLAALLLAGVMVFSFAACGNTESKDNNDKETATEAPGLEVKKVDAEDAADLLTKVWDAYGEDEKFSVMGGDMNNITDGTPGKYDFTKAEELGMESQLCFPAASVQFIDDAASMIHAMMANNFTCGAYRVTQATTVQPLVDSIKGQVEGNQWMCGFPEQLIIVNVGDEYVVSAYGALDLIENFKTKLTTVYGDVATVVVDQSLM